MGQIWAEQDFLGDLTRIFERGSVVFVWGGAAGGFDIFLSAVYCKHWRNLRFGGGAGH